jgi:hypothetical protein
LEPTEFRSLPLPASLVDLDGREIATTPEWAGSCPGTVSFHAGTSYLLVAPDAPTPELDYLVDRLLAELRAPRTRLGSEDERRMAVLTAGLELMAGRPLAADHGSAEEVIDLALAGIRSRAQELEVAVAGPLPQLVAPAAAAIALALVQLAVNAQRHEGAVSVTLRVAAGPTFTVEWPSTAPAQPISTHRHALRRSGWGWGFVQMVADALGGAALPPGPVSAGTRGACLSLGANRLGLPIAVVREGRIERATQAWDEDPRLPAFGDPVEGLLARLTEIAKASAGRIVYEDLYRARTNRDSTWIVLAPESGANRVRDLLSGLQHERGLWSAPEPYATRAAALVTLLQVAMGDPWPSVPPSVFAEVFPGACAALGVEMPPELDTVAFPEPRVTAFLLAELDGSFACRGDEVWFSPSTTTASSPLMRALNFRRSDLLRINS